MLWVDASAAPGGNGTLAAPFKFIKDAIQANHGGNPSIAGDGDIIRIVGNGGADGNLSTIGDNLSYNIGYNIQNGVLSDGTTMEIPADLTVMIDAGTIFPLAWRQYRRWQFGSRCRSSRWHSTSARYPNE